MIEVDHVSKDYGSFTAVKDLSFTVERGEILGFLGPNGAGKTTTMRIITGFFPPTSGRARVAGHDVLDEPLAAKSKIGYLPENPPLYPEMSVTDYLDFVVRIKGVARAERAKRIDDAIERCALADVRQKLTGHLSKGYRQRVGLAQAIVHDPQVLILDEPTAGLDPKQINETRELIKSLGGEHTVILSTHILPEVSITCDRVVIINGGRVVAQGTPQSLTEQVAESTHLDVVLEGDAETVETTLANVDGVIHLERASTTEVGAVAFRVEAAQGQDPRRAIAEAAVHEGLGVLELRRSGMSLEDIYLRVITSEEA